MVGLQLDVLHVCGAGPDVFGGDVPSAQRLDEAPVGPKECLPIGPVIVSDDDRLAPAEIDAGHCGLIGHATGEPQRIGDGFFGAAVLPEAGSPERRTECGIVDRYDSVVAAGWIVGEQQLLVSHRLHLRENAGWRPGTGGKVGRTGARVAAAPGGENAANGGLPANAFARSHTILARFCGPDAPRPPTCAAGDRAD